MQVVAFGYGFHVICLARPVFIVGEVDRLVVVPCMVVSGASIELGNAIGLV